MAVTFTLDLRALLAAPAAFALSGATDPSVDESQLEPIELIHALRTHANKLTVFSQTGEISLPPSRKVFAFLERAVIPVTAPRGGVVHPKVWVLRYQPTSHDDTEARLRVLIASRNLTFDVSWDTVLRLDETTESSGVLLEPIGELFDTLLSGVGDISDDHVARVQGLSTALQTARFALPTGVDDLNVHLFGLGPSTPPFPTNAQRATIISPFVSSDFFTSVWPRHVDEVVSRHESLDRLAEAAFDNIGAAFTFDDTSNAEPLEDDSLSPLDPGRPLRGLHAKVFAFEDQHQAHVFVGSANATAAAFNSNIEVLVELVGPTETLGIDSLFDGTDDEPGLRQLFCTYTPAPDEEPEPDEATGLDQARRAIARLPLRGRVEQSSTGWSVTYESDQPIPMLDATKVVAWPLASAGNRKTVDAGVPVDLRFETSLESISGFLAFELTDQDGATTGFVVPVPLSGVPEERDRLLLRALVGNAERFLRYLMALLDEDSDHHSVTEVVDQLDGSADRGGAAQLPVLEKLLRAMRRSPDKLAALHPLVTDLGSDDALPPGFAELWDTIYDVALAEVQSSG
jgi:hypothetical protein